MTGPEHYAEAERLLSHPKPSTVDLQKAAVHATLALAWATAPSGLVAEEGTGG